MVPPPARLLKWLFEPGDRRPRLAEDRMPDQRRRVARVSPKMRADELQVHGLLVRAAGGGV
jgi:hypothetical protein